MRILLKYDRVMVRFLNKLKCWKRKWRWVAHGSNGYWNVFSELHFGMRMSYEFVKLLPHLDFVHVFVAFGPLFQQSKCDMNQHKFVNEMFR